MADDQFNALRDELRQLAKLDRRLLGSRRRVFGADMHRFRSSPASAAELHALEEDAGALPEEFRRFLLTVGSGAGPYYGIFSVAEISAELQSMRSEADHAKRQWPRPDLPFPLSRDQADEALAQRETIETTVFLDGCLIIGHQGSGTQWTVLAVSGPLAGTVWDLGWFAGFDAEWWPARVAPGVLGVTSRRVDITRPPLFLEWFKAWIDQARSDLLAAQNAR